MRLQIAKALTLALGATLLVAACAQPEKPESTSAALVASGPAAAAVIQGGATVAKINRKTREVTLKRADGSLVTMVAGDEVKNFNQIRVGDIVEAEIIEAVAVAVEPATTKVRERRESETFERAKPGEKPAARSTHRVEIVATVQGVDPKSRMITIKGAVQTVTLKVGDGVDLSNIKRGDNVYVVYLESYSVRVRSPRK